MSPVDFLFFLFYLPTGGVGRLVFRGPPRGSHRGPRSASSWPRADAAPQGCAGGRTACPGSTPSHTAIPGPGSHGERAAPVLQVVGPCMHPSLTLSLSLSPPLSHSLTLSPPLTHSLSPSLTLTLSPPLTHSLTHSTSHSLFHPLSVIHSLLPLSLPLPLSLTHSPPLTFSPSHSFILSPSHSLFHPLSLIDSLLPLSLFHVLSVTDSLPYSLIHSEGAGDAIE